ncbi:MAG: hypothetical protein LBF27_00685 [Sphingobacterium sp.]|jgi:hypothetical protein|nr:hypothetical protein [Sphingobacterium sp.]
MKEKKDKNQLKEIFFIIVYALIATAVLASIILLINCYWPKQTLFHAETWGTISDWFTYLVTLIGGVFIYKTLESQMTAQEDQSILKQIELNKHLYSIKPSFKFDFNLIKEIENEYQDDKAILVEMSIITDKPVTYKIIATSSLLVNICDFNLQASHAYQTFEKNTRNVPLILLHEVINKTNPVYFDIFYRDIELNEYLLSLSLFVIQESKEIQFKKFVVKDRLENITY